MPKQKLSTLSTTNNSVISLLGAVNREPKSITLLSPDDDGLIRAGSVARKIKEYSSVWKKNGLSIIDSYIDSCFVPLGVLVRATKKREFALSPELQPTLLPIAAMTLQYAIQTQTSAADIFGASSAIGPAHVRMQLLKYLSHEKPISLVTLSKQLATSNTLPSANGEESSFLIFPKNIYDGVHALQRAGVVQITKRAAHNEQVYMWNAKDIKNERFYSKSLYDVATLLHAAPMTLNELCTALDMERAFVANRIHTLLRRDLVTHHLQHAVQVQLSSTGSAWQRYALAIDQFGNTADGECADHWQQCSSDATMIHDYVRDGMRLYESMLVKTPKTDLVSRKKQFVDILNGEAISKDQAALELGWSYNTANRVIDTLYREGNLKKIREGKYTYYYVG